MPGLYHLRFWNKIACLSVLFVCLFVIYLIMHANVDLFVCLFIYLFVHSCMYTLYVCLYIVVCLHECLLNSVFPEQLAYIGRTGRNLITLQTAGTQQFTVCEIVCVFILEFLQNVSSQLS